MTIRKQTPEELLALDKFAVDERSAHIVLDNQICKTCSSKPCLVVCPATLYRLQGGDIQFDYAGCLECGTCRIICANKGLTKWSYPRGSFGVSFRYG